MAERQSVQDRIENDFAYHAADSVGRCRMDGIRVEAHDLAELIVSLVPEGREQSLALTNLEQAMFWANAGIARSAE